MHNCNINTDFKKLYKWYNDTPKKANKNVKLAQDISPVNIL